MARHRFDTPRQTFLHEFPPHKLVGEGEGRFSPLADCEIEADNQVAIVIVSYECTAAWSQWPGLNRRPTVYETVALPLSYIGTQTHDYTKGAPSSLASKFRAAEVSLPIRPSISTTLPPLHDLISPPPLRRE